MAKLINGGWSKPGDEIPEPIGIIMGRNLRRPEPTEQQQEQPAAPRFRVRTLEEARALGIPETNDLVIHPVPRKR